MIWNASDHLFSWKPNGVELELAGSVLTVRQRGTSFHIDVASPSVEMTMHHFAVMRGSILRLRSGNTEVTVAGEAYAATDRPYADEPLSNSHFFLPKADFESFDRALAKSHQTALPPTVSDSEGQRRSFLLWGNLDTLRDTLRFWLVVGIAMVLCVAGIKLQLSIIVDHSDVVMAICQIGLFGGIVYQVWWKLQRAKPALLVIEGDTFTLSRLKPRAALRSWKRSEADIRLTVWRTSASKIASSQLLPVVEIRVRGELVVSAALNAQKLSPGAPRGRTPRYLVDWLWSAAFFDRVVPAAARMGWSIEPVRGPEARGA